MTSIFTAPVYKLEDLNNIFIELTAKNCNQRCKNCYLDLPVSTKTVKDFLSVDRIKEALNDTKNENIHCIYLTGAEPMTHPDFNTILRLCFFAISMSWGIRAIVPSSFIAWLPTLRVSGTCFANTMIFNFIL